MYSCFNLIPCIFLFLTLLAGRGLAATPAYEIQPLRLNFDSKGQVFAAFIQPCGSIFSGFLYRATAMGELQVGVVLLRSPARCLGWKEVREIPLPLVNASSYAGLASMNPSLEAPLLTAAPMQNIHQTPEALHAVYTSLCGSAVGLLVQASEKGHALGILESSKIHRDSCTRSTKILSLSGLDLTRLGQTSLIQNEKEEAAPYTLRRVPVQLQRTGTSQGLALYSVRYLRSCNDAPIGLVRKDRDLSSSLTMLVAHYPAMECPSQGPQKLWSHWQETLRIPSSQALVTIRRAQDEQLRLVRPISYALPQKGAARKALSIKTFSSCDRDLGLVSRRQGSAWALGILQTDSAEPCNSRLKKVTYRVDLNSDPVTEVKPLQLVGS